MSDNGCDSGRAVVREGKTAVQEQVGERSEKCERSSPTDTNVSAAREHEVPQE